MNAFIRLPITVNRPGLAQLPAESVRPLANIAPDPPDEATDEWLFGGSAASLVGVKASNALTLVGSVTYQANYAELAGGKSGLIMPWLDAGLQTQYAVVQIPAPVTNGGKLILGALTPTALGDGGSALFFGAADSDQKVYVTVRGAVNSGSTQTYNGVYSVGDWIFVALAENLGGSNRELRSFIGGRGATEHTAAAEKQLFGDKVAFGQAYYEATSFAATPLKIAAAGYAPSCLSAAALQDLYVRTKLRLLMRGIEVK